MASTKLANRRRCFVYNVVNNPEVYEQTKGNGKKKQPRVIFERDRQAIYISFPNFYFVYRMILRFCVLSLQFLYLFISFIYIFHSNISYLLPHIFTFVLCFMYKRVYTVSSFEYTKYTDT